MQVFVWMFRKCMGTLWFNMCSVPIDLNEASLCKFIQGQNIALQIASLSVVIDDLDRHPFMQDIFSRWYVEKNEV